MKKLLSIIGAASIIALSAFTFAPLVSAQSNECRVSGEHGALDFESNKAIGYFSVSGAANCAETQVSIAVWVCTPKGCNNDIVNQRLHDYTTAKFDLSDAADRGYAKIASISTSMPTTKQAGDGCSLQVDLVRGRHTADPSHQYPNGPFYDGRRMLSTVVANPACKEVQTVVEEKEVIKEVEVPVEVVREVEVPVEVVREVQTERPTKELPNTGPGSLIAIPAVTSVAAGGIHYLRNRKQ